MALGRTKWILCAGVLAAIGCAAPARAVEIPIQIPGCPERDGPDLAQGAPAAESRRDRDEEQTCGGGGAGSDAAYAYPGVQLPATGGAAAGGAGGGTSARTAAARGGTPQGEAGLAPSGAQAFDSTGNVTALPSSAAVGTTASPQPVVGTPSPQAFNSTGNITYPTPAPRGSVGGLFGDAAGSVGHVAPLPETGGALAWLVALIAGAFFWRRRVRV